MIRWMLMAALIGCAARGATGTERARVGGGADTGGAAASPFKVGVVAAFATQGHTEEDGYWHQEDGATRYVCREEVADGVYDYAGCCPPGWVFLGIPPDESGAICGI